MKKDPEPAKELPPITTTGEQTFGCLVDGEVWLPESDKSWGPMQCRLLEKSTLLSVGMSRYVYDKGGLIDAIYFSINPFKGKQEYNSKNGFAFGFRKFQENKEYLLQAQCCGQVNIIAFDTIQHIVSGTFNVQIVDSINFDTLEVSEGRFDLRYDTQ